MKAWYSGKQELSMSSSHIILDFKSIRELGMVQSSIIRGAIKQKIGLGGGEVMKQIFYSGLICEG